MSHPVALHERPSKAIKPDGRTEMILSAEPVSGADDEDPSKRYCTQTGVPARFAAASPLSRPGEYSNGLPS